MSLALAACGGQSSNQGVFQATVPPTSSNAPIYTATPSITPSPTITPTPTVSPTSTFTPEPTATWTATVDLVTNTPIPTVLAPPAIRPEAAGFSAATGWSCEDFPCEDDIAGFLERIRVPNGFTLSHVGRFPGQVMQIAYGPDGRLYATVLENGTRNGAVYALNTDGTTQRYSETIISPIGLAFQPGTGALYVSGRIAPMQMGGIFRVVPGGGETETVVRDLPCCFGLIDNQPNGMAFGTDGDLYLGIGALTDHAESRNPRAQAFADIEPLEAGILRIDPDSGTVERYAQGLRNPYDVTFGADGMLYATDSGLLTGPGDRVAAVPPGAHLGWPYWRTRGCADCPLEPSRVTVTPDLYTFPDFSLPRGMAAYNGLQFPANYGGSLFVALWNGTPEAQRVVRIDPRDPRLGSEDYAPEPFVTGLIRPVDVVVTPDGSLVVADYVYGHVWRVSYEPVVDSQ